MTKKRDEPSALKRGKIFHSDVQKIWEDEAEGDTDCEKVVTKPSGSTGRIDVYVDADEELGVVVEIKSTNWNRMSDAMVRRTIAEYSKQVWDYIDSKELRGKDICPGIVLIGKPADEARTRMIDELFEEDGIPVSWQDETVEESRVRHKLASPD